jgi:hypothetical protein
MLLSLAADSAAHAPRRTLVYRTTNGETSRVK